MLRTLLTAAAVALAGPAAAAGAGAGGPPQAPSLKAAVTVAHAIVRIGDLVDHAGAAAAVAIFRAPDLGQTGAVPAQRVVEAVRAHGLATLETHGLSEVVVTRPAREIGGKEIEGKIVAALRAAYRLAASPDLTVTFDHGAAPLLVDPAAGELRVVRASYDSYSGRYAVTFEIPGAHNMSARGSQVQYSGVVTETAEVAVLLRALARGDIIGPDDVALERRPKASVNTAMLTSLKPVIGFAARRPLQRAQPLSVADVMKPELVLKNEAVTITYEAPGMTLSVRGKALDSGAEGEMVSVFNAQTKRTLQGVVAGPGRVAIVTTFAAAARPDVTGSIAAQAASSRAE